MSITFTKEEYKQAELNRKKLMPYIEAEEVKQHLPKDSLLYLIQHESAFQPRVMSGEIPSSAGALHLAQFMPDTAEEIAGQLGIPLDEISNPLNQIKMAGHYFGKLYRNNERDPELRKYAITFALAEYNAGPNSSKVKAAKNLARKGLSFIEALSEETRKYVKDTVNNVIKPIRSIPLDGLATPTKKFFSGFGAVKTNIDLFAALSDDKKQVIANWIISISK